ncbi:hypothetical protein BX666DRAFT_2024093 [Dichotomocladium elegans]|nr:hypothetical protein BX666DRAFT_2024093 [Dichotomocladium elegans]
MIGPEIPKEILEKKQQQQHDAGSEPSSPSHPPPLENDGDASNAVSVGPVIPPELLARKRQQQESVETDEKEDNDSDDADAYAPALPPDLLEERRKRNAAQQPSERRRRAPVGPALPSSAYDLDHNDDDDIVGPVLPSDYNREEASVRSTIEDIEERARKSREAMDESRSNAKSDKIERPEWMLVPPEIDYLRGADSSRSRGFNTSSLSAKERDRSVWTDTPADRERKRKSDHRKDDSGHHISQKDRETRQNIDQYNASKRAKTLMEIHKEMGGRRRTEQEDAASRPFDREKDFLNAPRRKVDRHQRDEMLKRAGELGSRFGSSRSSFL